MVSQAPIFISISLFCALVISGGAASAGVGRSESAPSLLDTGAPALAVAPIPLGTTYRGGETATFTWSYTDANPSSAPAACRAWLEIDGARVDSLSVPSGEYAAIWAWPVPERISPHCYLEVTVVDSLGNVAQHRSDRFTILTSTTDVADGEAVPLRAGLLPPRPNPFNPSTTVAYDLPWPAAVRLEAFDVRGRSVRLLAAGSRTPGRHSLAWDGTDDGGRRLPAGTYLLRLTARGAAATLVRTAKVVMVP